MARRKTPTQRADAYARALGANPNTTPSFYGALVRTWLAAYQAGRLDLQRKYERESLERGQ